MSNFDITELLTDGQTNDINVDRWTDKRTEKRTSMSQSQEVREMFLARFDGCLVLYLIRILTLT